MKANTYAAERTLDNVTADINEARRRLRSLINERSQLTKEPFLHWPPALRSEHLCNCHLLPNRLSLLDCLPKGGVVAEIGTQRGLFAKEILHRAQPARLEIIDIDF